MTAKPSLFKRLQQFWASADLGLIHHRRERRMRILASLVMLTMGVIWAIFFALRGAWGMVAMDMVLILSGLTVFTLTWRQHVRSANLVLFSVLLVIISGMAAILDVPNAAAPRATHLYLLPLGVAALMAFRDENLGLRYGVTSLCLLIFTVLAATSWTPLPGYSLPNDVRESGTWVQTCAAMLMLFALLHVLQTDAAERSELESELQKALAANWAGEYEKVRKMCFEDAPKHGNDIPEVNRMTHRVYESILTAFNNVDGGGNYLSKDIKSVPDAYTKSIHNLMGMVTGALPNGKRAGVALTDGSLSAMPGTDVNGPTALVMSAAKSQDAVKYSATHMNVKLPPDQLKSRKGRDNVLRLVKTLFDNGGYHIQFNVLDTNILRDAQKHPEKYRDLVVRVAGFSAFFTKLHVGVQNELIERTLQSFGPH